MKINISKEKQNGYAVGDLIRIDTGNYLMIVRCLERYNLVSLNGETILYGYKSIEGLLNNVIVTERYKNNELEIKLKGE